MNILTCYPFHVRNRTDASDKGNRRVTFLGCQGKKGAPSNIAWILRRRNVLSSLQGAVISIGMVLRNHHANLILTYTNMSDSSIVMYTTLIFTTGTRTSGNQRQIHGHPDSLTERTSLGSCRTRSCTLPNKSGTFVPGTLTCTSPSSRLLAFCR
jgi:hypothetical protein